MTIDLGKTQIDTDLLNALTAEGIPDSDARELSRMDAFGGSPIPSWLRGLSAAAVLMNQGSLYLDYGTLPDPWGDICPALMPGDGIGTGEALAGALELYPTNIQSALINAIGTIAAAKAAEASKHKLVNLTKGLNTNQAEAAECVAELLMQPIDPDLVKRIRRVLSVKSNKELAYKRAGEILIDWLSKNGTLIRTTLGEHYYLYRPTHRLFNLDTTIWHAWLYRASDCNPASTAFKYLLADCRSNAIEFGKRMDVVRVAHWDQETKTLRVSRFDGTVYRLDGLTIDEESNGDGPVLFDDAFHWTPYVPDYSAKGSALEWTCQAIPSWEQKPDEQSLLYQVWWTGTFFTELCPTRPILVLKGEKGSGKTMALRVMLRMIFGPAIDVSGVPSKPDAFTALTSNSHIVVIDNMDDIMKGIRNKIASLSTGMTDQVRKLYTTNETHTIRYRCWLAITSRTPDTLQRDDLVDRIVILPVQRIEDNDRTREAHFLLEVITNRNRWWGDCLTLLNSVVAEIRRSGIPLRGGLRMEDWAALGTVIARAGGQVNLWESGLKDVKNRQADFLLEDDVLVQGIESWLRSQQYTNVALTTRRLYEETKRALFGTDRPEDTWPSSVQAYGRRLRGMESELRERLAKANVAMIVGRAVGDRTYRFEKWP